MNSPKLASHEQNDIKDTLRVKSTVRPAKKDRLNWLLDWVGASQPGIDVLDADFVQAYINYSMVSYQFTMLGAHRCKQLTKDLCDLSDARKLWKGSIRVPPMMGFPSRVNVYHLLPQYQEVYDTGFRFWPTRK